MENILAALAAHLLLIFLRYSDSFSDCVSEVRVGAFSEGARSRADKGLASGSMGEKLPFELQC